QTDARREARTTSAAVVARVVLVNVCSPTYVYLGNLLTVLWLIATRNNAAAPGVSHRFRLHHQQRTHVLPPRSRTRKSQRVREGQVGAFGWEKRSSCTEGSESYFDHVERHWFQGPKGGAGHELRRRRDPAGPPEGAAKQGRGGRRRRLR
ncbi:unnamed protein product, partial [Ectocarpus sp. 12 AP-2014]